MHLKTYKIPVNVDQHGQDLFYSMIGSASPTGNHHKNLKNKITLEIDQDPILYGDVYFKIMNKGSLGSKLIC